MRNPRPKQHPSISAYSRKFLSLLAVVLISFGCDGLEVTPGGDSIFLSTSRVICFEFQDVDNGAGKTIVSSDSFDLGSFLSGEGFAKSEIIGARVTDISLRLRFPGQENLSVFSDARVSLRANSTTTIGTASNFGNERATALTISGNDIGAIVRAASFQGVLEITGADDIQDDFLVEVEVDFDVEVEGV